MTGPTLDPALAAELEGVPDVEFFLGPEELSVELASVARTGGLDAPRIIGYSREGRAIECLTIGDGQRDAVVFGLPHPNEPIGGLTALHLARELAAGRALGLASEYRWHVVPCVDPDGLALNAGWLRGPFDLETYARHFYRPAGDEQVEWAFPFEYKRARFDTPLPETLALMDLIDQSAPAFMASLHNSELGGVYYYLTEPQIGLYDTLRAIPAHLGLPLHAGEAEAPYMETLSDGIYRWPDTRDAYDDAERRGIDPMTFMSGASSPTYAERHGCVSIVAELPYWRDPRAADRSPSGHDLAAALRAQADAVEEVAALLNAGLATVSAHELSANPLLRSSAYFARALAGVPVSARGRADDAQNRREATVAELHSIEDVAHSFRLRFVGMLRRGLAELPAHSARALVTQQVADRHEHWIREAARHVGAEPFPIRLLVATQYAATLALGRHLLGSTS